MTNDDMPALDGLRHPDPRSLNTGWKNLSFRGYGDYMQAESFRLTLDELVALADAGLPCLVCA